MNNSVNKINIKKNLSTHSVKSKGSERIILPGKAFIYDMLTDGIVEFDSDNKILNCNASYEKMTGYSLKELKKKSIIQIISPRFIDKKPKTDQLNSGETGYLRKFNTEYTRKDGTVFPVEKTVYFIKDNNSYLAVVRDITRYELDKKEMQAHTNILKRTNAELDNFVSIISHDLKTPITTISAFMKIFEDDYFDKIDENGKDIILRIKSSIRQMSTTINDLRELSKLSKVENPFENVNVYKLVKTIVDRVGFIYENKLLIFKIESTMPVVFCDKIKIEQMFSNLIDNAVKYSSKKTGKNIVVEIGYEDKNEFHLFYVKDNGIGIEEMYLDRIFYLFERLHTADEYEGTGAGLYIVQTIIKQHKGEIWVDSIPGEGSSFYFTIPKNLKP